MPVAKGSWTRLSGSSGRENAASHQSPARPVAKGTVLLVKGPTLTERSPSVA